MHLKNYPILVLLLLSSILSLAQKDILIEAECFINKGACAGFSLMRKYLWKVESGKWKVLQWNCIEPFHPLAFNCGPF